MRNATNVVLAVVSITATAEAEERASIATAEMMRAPGHDEVLLGTRLAMRSIEVEVARFDFVDFTGGTSFDIRGGFLGWAYRIERPRWGMFAGVHTFTLWNDGIRYLTPWAGVHAGEVTRASVEVRSAGVFAKVIEEDTSRAIDRDFDIAARLSTPVGFARIEARARYRDTDMGALHVRDVFLGAGVELAIQHGAWRGVPTFIGIGWRNERWRDEEAAIAARVVEPDMRSRWQALLWLEVDIGVIGPERD